MGAEFYKGTRLDESTGRELCCNCFDGRHFYVWSSKKFDKGGSPMKEIRDSHKGTYSNCLQGACECPCVKLQLEKSNRVTPKQRKDFQKKIQQTLFTDNVSEQAR